MAFKDTLKLLSDSFKALPYKPELKHIPLSNTHSAQISDTINSAVPASHQTIPHFLLAPKADSIDSVSLHDTIKAVIQLPSGYEGIMHPSLPQTESWIFITLLILFFLLVFSISRSKGMINEIIQNFFQVKERSSLFSKATINDFRFRFFIILFSIIVLSLYSYLGLNGFIGAVSISRFSIFLLVAISFFGLKSLFMDLLGYVFLDTSNLKMAKDSYFNILSFLGILLFPLLILNIYGPESLCYLTEIISLITCIIAFIFVCIKLFQIFFHKIATSFYILLYLCTLEIIPLLIMYKVYQLLV